MVNCCVPNCMSRSDRNGYVNADGSKITFHGFPRSLQREWCLAIRRRGDKPNVLWTPKSSSAVCSRHFLDTDFRYGLKKKCLRSSAIPSIFENDSRQLSKKKPSKDLHANVKNKKIKKKFVEATEEKETSQILPQPEPKLVKAWSCSKIVRDCQAGIIRSNESETLPSFIRQALIEKERIELTYEETNATNVSDSMTNGNIPVQLEEPHQSSPTIKIETDFFNENCGQSSTFTNINVPCFESLASVAHSIANPDSAEVINTNFPLLALQNIIHNPTSSCINGPYVDSLSSVAFTNPNHTEAPENTINNLKILSVESSSTRKVMMCDAATSTTFRPTKDKLGECRKMIADYRKQIRTLRQKNRRYKSNLLNMKHSVFCELQNRRYLATKPDCFINKQGCILDRNSIRECQSSDTDESEED